MYVTDIGNPAKTATASTTASSELVNLRMIVASKHVAMAPMMAPAIGATQNSHNCSIAQPPTNSAGPVERAGFTDVFVTGMLIK
ncbi:hypothetical protein G6F22_021826 [Rhizopus arrhizus]|nr:hypothetical protein G6F22_021826 [Rhizopus arrhizus]